MRQAILVEPKHIEFKEATEPKATDLKAHQVLVNIKRIGICGSEIHSYHGLHPATFYPVVQGHEYSGIVVVAVFAKDPALSMFHLGEHELRLIGSMMYRHEDYITAIDYVNKGIINLKPLISNRFAFEEYDDAYQFIDSHRETSMKVIVDLEQKPGENK